jgi:hypothetical protein
LVESVIMMIQPGREVIHSVIKSIEPLVHFALQRVDLFVDILV